MSSSSGQNKSKIVGTRRTLTIAAFKYGGAFTKLSNRSIANGLRSMKRGDESILETELRT
jgi:hypothetical protein